MDEHETIESLPSAPTSEEVASHHRYVALRNRMYGLWGSPQDPFIDNQWQSLYSDIQCLYDLPGGGYLALHLALKLKLDILQGERQTTIWGSIVDEHYIVHEIICGMLRRGANFPRLRIETLLEECQRVRERMSRHECKAMQTERGKLFMDKRNACIHNALLPTLDILQRHAYTELQLNVLRVAGRRLPKEITYQILDYLLPSNLPSDPRLIVNARKQNGDTIQTKCLFPCRHDTERGVRSDRAGINFAYVIGEEWIEVSYRKGVSEKYIQLEDSIKSGNNASDPILVEMGFDIEKEFINAIDIIDEMIARIEAKGNAIEEDLKGAHKRIPQLDNYWKYTSIISRPAFICGSLYRKSKDFKSSLTMTTSQPSLSILPSKSTEKILSNISLQDIKNLRLVSKSLAKQCIGPSFKQHFKTKTTSFSPESLDSLITLALHPELGPAVQNLTIQAEAYDTSEVNRVLRTKRRRVVKQSGVFTQTTEPPCTEDELLHAQRDLEWLQEQIHSYSTVSEATVSDTLATALHAFGELQILDLDCIVYVAPEKTMPPISAPEWYPIWQTASRSFRVLSLAIAKAQIPIDTLTIFRTAPRCSVASFDITKHVPALRENGFADAGPKIKNFALSVSSRVVTDFAQIEEARKKLEGVEKVFHNAMGSHIGLLPADSPEATAAENFPGIAELLSMMPNLEAVDLHFYTTLKGRVNAYSQIFDAVAEKCRFADMGQVFLRGLPLTEDALLRFLGNHPKTKELTLYESMLFAGSWEKVFAHLSAAHMLKKLHLSNLWSSEGHLMNLAPFENTEISHRQAYPCFGGAMVHTRDIKEKELRAGLKFKAAPSGRAMGSPAFVGWIERRKLEVGPPGVF
ncbi:hypothetical protein CC78DRAFT_621679 [Lojkania enalia]|uniref:F-box domain-containing protein n=1 Tax=Lojkania enalia TaxID=147567 RepID=A0A9P4MXT7_9PLEO|nr:hypothetical protein CC78DRAFT_621679 [Didymosphaeria enalia]